jgi:hypothetical protein
VLVTEARFIAQVLALVWHERLHCAPPLNVTGKLGRVSSSKPCDNNVIGNVKDSVNHKK